MAQQLEFRVPVHGDKEQILAAQAELAQEDFPFVFLKPGHTWEEYVAGTEHQRTALNLPPGRVPATMLVALLGQDIVGRVHIRHALNDELRAVGGHIGYAVRPAFRRRGYAVQLLLQGLRVCRDLGIQRALVTCDADNPSSIATIERCGGVLEDVVSTPCSSAKRRYWIDVSPPPKEMAHAD